MAEGWVKLDRSILEHWLWNEKPFDKKSAWVDLILLANYTDKKTMCKNELVTCKRGDVNLSISALASRWGWSRHKVNDFLEVLARDGMVDIKRTQKRTVITLVNYGLFQFVGTPEGTKKGQEKDTTKKEKKLKNVFTDFENRQNYDFEALERLMK